MDQMPADSFHRFCARTKIDVQFERVTLREAPYFMGAGFWYPYRVTLTRNRQKAEVIALLDNMIQQPTAHHLLFVLSEELTKLEKAETFEGWMTAIQAASIHNDAHFVHEPYKGDDRELLQMYAADQEYLQQRYAYLELITKTLQGFFKSDFQLFSDYWFRHIMSDWSDWPSV